MKIFRSLPTRTLLIVLTAAAAVVVAGAVAVSALGGSGPVPPAKPLAAAIHDALTGTAPQGITARISFTNHLLPSTSFGGQTGSPLLSGASGRLWVSQAGGRLELQSDAGDAQITWNDKVATLYDASSNTAYRVNLPQHTAGSGAKGTPPSLDEITKAITAASQYWSTTGAQPTNAGTQPAYDVTVSPKEHGGLLGSVEAAWDAANGTPLRIAITAKGASSPVLELEATDVSYGSVPASDVEVAPPAGAKIVDLSNLTQQHGRTDGAKPVQGLAAVQAAAPFTVVAPATLGGASLADARLLGGDTVVLAYGQGLDTLLVVERQAKAGESSPLDALPNHELVTPLGTVLEKRANGLSLIVAGSVTQQTAESAAAALG